MRVCIRSKRKPSGSSETTGPCPHIYWKISRSVLETGIVSPRLKTIETYSKNTWICLLLKYYYRSILTIMHLTGRVLKDAVCDITRAHTLERTHTHTSIVSIFNPWVPLGSFEAFFCLMSYNTSPLYRSWWRESLLRYYSPVFVYVHCIKVFYISVLLGVPHGKMKLIDSRTKCGL